MHAVLGPMGVRESVSRLITSDLRRVEDDVVLDGKRDARSGEGGAGAGEARCEASGIDQVAAVVEREKGEGERESGLMRRMMGVMKSKNPKSPEMGLTAFLLKYGEGMGTFPLNPSKLTRRPPPSFSHRQTRK